MCEIFLSVTVFNTEISRWNVGKVWNMDRMFRGATAFQMRTFPNGLYMLSQQSTRCSKERDHSGQTFLSGQSARC